MAPENQAQAQQSSGSFWMPLMAGYMMGRLMGGGAGFAQQPLFSSKNPASPAYGKYTDATGKNYGAAQPKPHHDRTEDGNGTKTGDHHYRYPWRFW